MNTSALQRAVDKVGGQTALARHLGVTQSVVWYWLKGAKNGCPAEYALKIEEATSGEVTRHELRPDIWPREGAAA